MEDKSIDPGAIALTIMRMECLLEEMIFQQILNRELDVQKANEIFNRVVEHTDSTLKMRVQDHTRKYETDNSGNISVL